MKNNIEYLDDTHTYLINGVIVPSVSELIKFKYPDMYADVPKKILKQSASYGTKVHDYIQKYVSKELSIGDIQKKNIDPNIKIAVEQFEILRNAWAFFVKDMEQIVHYKDKYAGRYDIKTIDNVIIDIKTTTELHTNWLSLQLGLYNLADGVSSDVGYCIWLPKGKPGKVVTIKPWSNEECIKLVEEYEKHIANN